MGTPGQSGYGIRVGTYNTTILPAIGYRDGTGATRSVYSAGYFWSSKPNSVSAGHNLGFGTSVNPSITYPIDGGFAVRCVPQKSHSVTVKAGPGGGTVMPSGTRSYHDGMVVPITATPSPGSKFANWTSTSDNVAINNTDSTVTMMVVKGTSTVTANFVPIEIRNSQSPYLLYWDSFTSAMQLGAWGVVTQGNMLFFQFGSVIGTTMTGSGDTWDTGDVKFNPTNISAAREWAAFADVPNYGNYTGDKALVSSISGGAYHTANNVRSGFGDPCKLVGLTLADILKGNFDNGMYRMPTYAENIASYGSGTRFVGTREQAGYGLCIGTDNSTFLPVTGRRSDSGETGGVYSTGYYWSSRAGSATKGHYLLFTTTVNPNYSYDARLGLAVRCVPQQSYAVTIKAGENGTVAQEGSANYHEGMSMYVAATPEDGYKFVNWTATGGVTLADANTAMTIITVNGAGTVTANFTKIEPNLVAPTAPYILYWDATTSTMQLGAWGGPGDGATTGGKVTQANMLFFKLGSVIGFPNNNDAWSAAKVKFNPSGVNYDIYSNIPIWDFTSDMGDGLVSSNMNHTLARVKAGRGDPCKLAGLTVADINGGLYDNKLYRLPTEAENIFQYGSGTQFVGTRDESGYGLRIGTDNSTFLPALGYPSLGGAGTNVYNGYYWSSRIRSATNGSSLTFSTSVTPDSNSHGTYGFAVRCVPQ